MRIHDIINEAGRMPYQDPMKTPVNSYKNDREDNLLRSFALANGKLPPEFSEIRTPTGMYDINKVTPEWMGKVANAHPNDPHYAWLAVPPESFTGWLTASDKRAKEQAGVWISTSIENLKRLLTDWNENYHPGGHYYNNRPYVQGIVPGYQADARTGKVETQSHNFDPVDIKYYLSSYKWCRDQNLMPVITPEQWIMLLLVEGSEEFGTRTEQAQNLSPAMQKIDQMLQQKGMVNDGQRRFCVTVMDKLTTAKRLGIPLYQAWNGSKIYLDRYNIQALAAQDPKNKQLVDLVNSILA